MVILSSISSTRRTLGHLAAVFVIFVLAQFAAGNVQSYRVVSRSMQPTLEVGDYVLMVKWQDYFSDLKGQVVVFEADDGGCALTKRVLAATNDEVRLQRGLVYVNGQRDLSTNQRLTVASSRTWDLRRGQLFVVGDNRNNSFDSIDHGPIPEMRVKGVVALRVWPLYRIGAIN